MVANEQARQLAAARNEELHPSRRLTQKLLIGYRLVTGVAALNMAAGQVLGIVFQPSTGPVQYVLRFYVVMLCVLVVLNELEYFTLTVESRILHNWITRGALYAFIGLLGLDENDTANYATSVDAGTAYLRAVAWIMIGIGALYASMGICCLQVVHDRARADYERRVELAKILRDGLPQHLSSTTAAAPSSLVASVPAAAS